MPDVLLSAPTKNSVQKTLASQLLSTAGASDPISFSDVDGIPNLPGVLVINRVDSNGTATASKREYIEYSGTSGNTVLIKTRNVDGSGSALTHAVGSIVEWTPDITWAVRMYTALSQVIDITDVTAINSSLITATGTSTLTNKDIVLGGSNYINSSGATISAILDEDTMSSNSPTALVTQQSVKAYVGKQTSVDSDATPTPTGGGKNNELYITALAEASELQAPSGTPVNGNKLLVRILDDATARALTYNAIYNGTLADLPSTTTISKTLYMLFLYNSEAVKWELVATGEEG